MKAVYESQLFVTENIAVERGFKMGIPVPPLTSLTFGEHKAYEGQKRQLQLTVMG
jgi:hypothetical protein